MPQMAPSSARGAQLLLPSSKPAQAAPSFTPKDQPSTSPSPGLTPSRPQATKDEALRAAVAEARQGGGSSEGAACAESTRPAKEAAARLRQEEGERRRRSGIAPSQGYYVSKEGDPSAFLRRT